MSNNDEHVVSSTSSTSVQCEGVIKFVRAYHYCFVTVTAHNGASEDLYVGLTDMDSARIRRHHHGCKVRCVRKYSSGGRYRASCIRFVDTPYNDPVTELWFDAVSLHYSLRVFGKARGKVRFLNNCGRDALLTQEVFKQLNMQSEVSVKNLPVKAQATTDPDTGQRIVVKIKPR